MRKYRFTSREFRVQLRVYPEYDKPAMFAVYVLPATANKFHAFTLKSSNRVYFGESLVEALGKVFIYVPGFQMPKTLRPFLRQ